MLSCFSRAICDPMDCSLPGCSVHEFLLSRILEWVAISFSRKSPQHRDQPCISYVSCPGMGGFFCLFFLRLVPPGKPFSTVLDFQSSASYLALLFKLCRSIFWPLFLKKIYDKPRQCIKSRDITLLTKVHTVKAVVFPVVIYGCESWTIRKAECWRIDAFESWCWRRLWSVSWTTRRSNQINPKVNQPWIFIGRTDTEALIIWPLDMKNWFIGKDPDAGKD